jgi:hypothetical protein
MNLSEVRSIGFRFVLGFSLFVIATLLGDFVFGPVVGWALNVPASTDTARWGIVVPFLVENGLILAVFGLAAKAMLRPTGDLSFYRLWLINAVSGILACWAYYVFVIDPHPAPALYHRLGGDFAHATWCIITIPSALLPLSAFTAVRYSKSLVGVPQK